MAKEASALIKEFRARDLKRMINLRDGKIFDSTSTQKGYLKPEILRKEGDRFEENGKEYVIEGGIKKNISKISNLRDMVKIPLFCPCCNKPLVFNIDKRMYKLKKLCLDCNINVEAKMKLDGTFEEYQKQYMTSNLKSELEDFKLYIQDFISNKNTITTSDGEVQEWSQSNVDITELLKSIDAEIASL